MTPANERKAKERKAKRDAGLVRVEVWVPADKADAVRAAIDQIVNAKPITDKRVLEWQKRQAERHGLQSHQK